MATDTPIDDELPHRKAMRLAREGARREAVVVKDTGNPVEMAREMTVFAIETLVDIARNGTSDNARLAAATALLDRGHGKPGQSVTVYQGSREMRQAWEYVDVMVERVAPEGVGDDASGS